MLRASLCWSVLFFYWLPSVSLAATRTLIWQPKGQNRDFSNGANWLVTKGKSSLGTPPTSEDTIEFLGKFSNADCIIDSVQMVNEIYIAADYKGEIHLELSGTGPNGELHVGEENVEGLSNLEGGNIRIESGTVFNVQGKHHLHLNGTRILDGNETGEIGTGTFELSDQATVYVVQPLLNEIDTKVRINDDAVMEIRGGQLDMDDNDLLINGGTLALLSGDGTPPFSEAIVANRIYLGEENHGLFEIKSSDHVTIDAEVKAWSGRVLLDLEATNLNATFKRGINLYGGDMRIESGDISIFRGYAFELGWDSSLLLTSEAKQWIIGDVDIKGNTKTNKMPELLFGLQKLGYGKLVIDGNLHLDYGSIVMTERFKEKRHENCDHLRITGDFTKGDNGAIFDYQQLGNRGGNVEVVFIEAEGSFGGFTSVRNLANNEYGVKPLQNKNKAFVRKMVAP